MGVATAARTAAARPGRRALIGVLALAVALLWLLFRGTGTLPHDASWPLFGWLNDVRAWVDENRAANPVLVLLIDVIRGSVDTLVETVSAVLHGLGWPGVSAVAAGLALVLAGRRVALLVGAGFLAFGVLGLWEESIDTLALTLSSVLLSLAVGFPVGILAARSDRLRDVLTPVLDVMQILPTFAYLAPLVLFFLIGPASAAIATAIYAVPTTIRIVNLGIRGVPAVSVEAARSLGATGWQVLRAVELPMARRTLVLAVNQTLMMALGMVVITALISAPGLGASIVTALQKVNVGSAFQAGLAIVLMAIVLDRFTAGAAERTEREHRSGHAGDPAARRRLVVGTVVVIGTVAVLSLLAGVGDDWPRELRFSFVKPVNEISDWVKSTFWQWTTGLKDAVTYGVINPLQSALVTAPWWLVTGTVVALALLAGSSRAAVTAGACLLGIIALGLWEHAMITLASVLVATFLTLLVGVALGILAARHDRFAAAQRPLLDAAQTMPAFVYLLPALALFGPTRFTAIVAALIYAAPPVIRLVEDGLRGVGAGAIEAARSTGTTQRQLLWKVQLPMARPALLLALNQGIVMVLAMVVVGALVGGGGLGYDVVTGFSQRTEFGTGLAAGFAIVLLGVLLDRITQAAGARRDAAHPLHAA
ncbi:MAG: ABC transporter permease [Chloroflexota bacterium]